MAPVAAAPGARLAGGFFTCSVKRAGAYSYPPVSSAAGQCAAVPGPAGILSAWLLDGDPAARQSTRSSWLHELMPSLAKTLPRSRWYWTVRG